MRRREFVAALGLAAALVAGHARAQRTRVPQVGVLVIGARDPEPFWRNFRAGLSDLGYVDGQNVAIVGRSANGDTKLLAGLAGELVALGVDVIVASETQAAEAAKRATAQIPIVMAPAGDPVGTGLVASLGRPGGNVTGLSNATSEAAAKSVELLRELVPGAQRFAALCSATNPFTKSFLEQVEGAGRTLGVMVRPVLVRDGDELAAAFPAMVRDTTDAVIVQPSLPLEAAARLALTHRLPAAAAARQFADAGGLLSFSGDLADSYRKAAGFVDRILKGGKPADLPVMLPTKFEFVVNMKTAGAMGLTVPATLLARADDLIE